MKYRPRLDEKRIKKVSFWLTESEHKMLKLRAIEMNQTMTNIILIGINTLTKERE